jgi:HSP20 family protein
MANVTRYSPFEGTLDDLFRGFFVRPVSFDGQSSSAPAQFRVEVAEKDNAYVLRGELPGVKKDDINITIDGDTVAITAEVKNEKDVKDGERVLRSERHYGKLYRAFTLGQAVDEAAAQAKYADGVLELTLPKKAAVQAKRISIQ